jgi:RNA polymerase-associated protein
MMILYAGTACPFSHRCRIVLFEKGMEDAFRIEHISPHERQEEIATLSPYGDLPVLVERDLILYNANIINEYIDERLPHPQLMPVDPNMRARARLLLHNFEQDLFGHVRDLEKGGSKAVLEKARIALRDNLTQLAPQFSRNRFMMGDEYSMLDVVIAPLLWRLQYYDIQLPRPAAPLLKYAEILFARPAFGESLTAIEKAMRK